MNIASTKDKTAADPFAKLYAFAPLTLVIAKMRELGVLG